jgi:hypothetical protein
MSLKIEQRLDGNTFTESGPRIFTTGAFLIPMEVTRNGVKKYIWVVDEFIDDTYDDKGVICSPSLYVGNKDHLL